MILKSLQWRLVSFFCLITFCLTVPIWIFLSKSVENKYYSMFKTKIEAGFNSWNLKTVNPTKDELLKEMEVNARVFSVAQDDFRYYTVTENNGAYIFSNDSEFKDNQKAATNELLKSDNYVQAMTGRENNRQILESYGGKQFFDYARPIGKFILYFRYYKDDWVDVLNTFNGIIVTSLVAALAIAFIVGYMLSKTITVPIGKLMNKARSIAAGDFDRLPEVKSNDEIGRLTESFNHMATSLKDTLTEISSEKNKMETIFNYMTDGVIAFNLKGEVIHTNPASREMLGVEEHSYTFNEYAKKYGINYSIEDVLYLNSHNTKEFNINIEDRTIKAYFAVVLDENGKPEGIIAVLQDITEQQRLDNMRKEFVANVSHELRTPLTSIKSYTESLLDGAIDDRETSEKFLGVINSEADRMTRLVKDLLQLTRLDNQQVKWLMEDISFSELVRSAVERMGLEARNKNQMLECLVLEDIPNIEADYGRIEQVVFNILSNAIKYTPENGKISAYIGKEPEEVYLKVTDTGIGIPESDLPRIFERFYRVDKARSREMGGTGLGLSIAREIVEAHSGSISISSETNKGTEVTVRLPFCRPGHERLSS